MIFVKFNNPVKLQLFLRKKTPFNTTTPLLINVIYFELFLISGLCVKVEITQNPLLKDK